MIHALHPAQLRRMEKPELKHLAESCEKALLAGTSTNQDMLTLIEVEKELLRRERVETKQSIMDVRKTMVGLTPLPDRATPLPDKLTPAPDSFTPVPDQADKSK